MEWISTRCEIIVWLQKCETAWRKWDLCREFSFRPKFYDTELTYHLITPILLLLLFSSSS